MEQKIHSRAFLVKKSAPAAAREWLHKTLEHLDAQKRHDAVLAVSELVTNTVVHSGLGPNHEIMVQVVDDGRRVYVEVCDQGKPFAFRRGPIEVSDVSGGRGLAIVEAVADSFGAHSNGSNRVWFELRH